MCVLVPRGPTPTACAFVGAFAPGSLHSRRLTRFSSACQFPSPKPNRTESIAREPSGHTVKIGVGRLESGGEDGLIDVTDLPSLREPIEVTQLGE